MEKTRCLVRNQQKLQRMTNQSKLRMQPVRHALIYKLGVQVPRNSKEAILLDPKYQYKWTTAVLGQLVEPGLHWIGEMLQMKSPGIPRDNT